MQGFVTDGLGRPVAGALVAVLDGPLAGTTKLTDGAGRFELTGTAAAAVTLRVSRDGFQTRTQTLSRPPPTSDAPFRVHFWLDTLEPPIGLDPGAYTLTIAIDLATASTFIPQAPCAGFPIQFASRSYRATIAEVSSPADHRYVSADDPTLDWSYPFVFGIVGRFVGFDWDDALTEAFPGFRYLDIQGTAPTTEPAIASGSSVSIPFNGSFTYCQLKHARGIYNHCGQVPAEVIVDYHWCTSPRATMVFTKR